METLGYNSWKLPKGSKNELEKTPFHQNISEPLDWDIHFWTFSSGSHLCLPNTANAPTANPNNFRAGFSDLQVTQVILGSLSDLSYSPGSKKNWPTYRLDLGDPRPQKQVLVDTFLRDRNALGHGRRCPLRHATTMMWKAKGVRNGSDAELKHVSG